MSRDTLAQRLRAHRSALAACRRCGYADPTVAPILSEARSPRVLLVGQAPGKVEAGGGRPFAGRAGRTLFRWLEQAGVDEATARERIYISAVTRCYPGPSPSGRGDRVPGVRERSACGGWLDAEIELIRPALIIPVGRLAIDRFLGGLPLDEVVGQLREIELPSGRSEVVALPHPSGASSWINLAAHRALLDAALALLRGRFERLGVLSEMLSIP